MEVWHRITFSKYHNVIPILDKLKIKYLQTPGLRDYFIVTLEIKESDPRWPQISQIVQEKNATDLFNTVFTDSEILEAEWIRLQPVYQQGYPYPKDDWRENTYENQCPKCGIGFVQKAPFRIKKEPKMSKNEFWGLNWTYSLFCTSKVLKILNAEHIKGYEVQPVIIHNMNESSKIYSQLLFPDIANPALADEDKLQPETCSDCGVTKYLYHKRGYMHLKREALLKNTDFQLSNEWIGSGRYGGFREILISNRVANLIINNKWQGVVLKPVELI